LIGKLPLSEDMNASELHGWQLTHVQVGQEVMSAIAF
jgi:hypothetical protein